jgi:dihydrofolate synthase/folylpolyglutamate synthase
VTGEDESKRTGAAPMDAAAAAVGSAAQTGSEAFAADNRAAGAAGTAASASAADGAAPDDFDPVAYLNLPRWRSAHLGLDRIRALLDRLGRPQDRLKFVHVAGTNGKGSTSAFMACILQEAGYRCGLFTSPYIRTFEERIRIDGRNIPAFDLARVAWDVRCASEAIFAETGDHPTEFEMMTAVAFSYFARERCDIAVIEVGLGGRLDSTNVIAHPEVSIIARIGLDHTALLGDTLGKIAAEKAGIVKDGCPVVSWPNEDAGARAAIEGAARDHVARLIVPDFSALAVDSVSAGVRPFSYRGERFETRLLGSYQPYNATLAIEAACALRGEGWNVSDEAVRSGIAHTSWPARFEVVEAGSGAPTIVVDGGHNPQGAVALADSLADVFPGKRPVFVMGVLADKDYRSMIDAVIPKARCVLCIAPPNPRALSADDLARVLRSWADEHGRNLPVEACPDAVCALKRARELAPADGIVCAFGSLYSVDEVMRAVAATRSGSAKAAS